MITSVSQNGQIEIPDEFRELDGISPGQPCSIQRVEAGKYVVEVLKDAPTENLVTWLLRCPVKDWFEPLMSEQTDTL